MTETDRQSVDRVLRRYGEAWSAGLDGLERDYDVRLTARGWLFWRRITVTLRLRQPPWARYELEVRPRYNIFSFRGPTLPDERTASTEDLARIDAALRETGSLYWLTPGGNVECRDVRAGIAT